jgi:hypothetical protein
MVIVNDSICLHNADVDIPSTYLCGDCSHAMWTWNARVIGSGGLVLTQKKLGLITQSLARMVIYAGKSSSEVDGAAVIEDFLALLPAAVADPLGVVATPQFRSEPSWWLTGSNETFAYDVRADRLCDLLERKAALARDGGVSNRTLMILESLARAVLNTNSIGPTLVKSVTALPIPTGSWLLRLIAEDRYRILVTFMEAVLALFEEHTTPVAPTAFTRADRQLLINEAKLVNA